MNRSDLINYKSTGFACYRGSVPSVLVEGPDTWDFLNRITTRKFSSENLNESLSGALLTGKSEIQCLFQAWNKGLQAVELFPLAGGHEILLECLDKMHFSENLELKVQDQLTWIELRSDEISLLKTDKVVEENLGDKRLLIIPMDNWGIRGALMGGTEAEDLMSVVKMQLLKILNSDDYQQVRAYYGFPSATDFISRYQILEMGFDRFIDRAKGCYPGQEVVEKIYTYGKPAKKLVRITLKTSEDEIKKFSSDTENAIYSDKDLVGSLCQIHQLQDGEYFSLGVVQRLVVEKGLQVTLGLNGPTGQIELLT